ncbi:MAG: hypothetical protein M1538_00160 [Candidatus Marsarchaeota archaeon]|jgi:hypothetical protein|nr:hypothetical protein [Candidatus Marsarchaeota archaeon]
MRAFIISDNFSNGIIASNLLNKFGHNALISEEDATDSRTLISEITSNINNYDILFVLNKSPRLLEMQINKLQKVMAAVCKDEEDAKELASSNANVIIIHSGTSKDELEYILNIIVNNVSKEQVYNNAQTIKVQAPQTKIVQKINKSKLFQNNNIEASAQPKNILLNKQKQNKNTNNNIINNIKAKGLSKFLKDSLGIEDSQ